MNNQNVNFNFKSGTIYQKNNHIIFMHFQLPQKDID